MFDMPDHSDMVDAHGVELGHVNTQDGEFDVTDELGSPEFHSATIGTIHMILDNHDRELGTFDASGVHMTDGESFHFDHSPFENSLVSDTHPGDVAHFEVMPNGDTTVVDPSYRTVAVVRKAFGL